MCDETIQAVCTASGTDVGETHRELALIAIVDERARQVVSEGWTPEHDDHHEYGALAKAAAAYAQHAGELAAAREQYAGVPINWPFSWDWWKPKSRWSDLVRAGALILAEMERLSREAKSTGGVCEACGGVITEGDQYYHDASGFYLHAECCGPDRESFVNADGEPLKEDEPIPTPSIWEVE